jgi:hypothetical protein
LVDINVTIGQIDENAGSPVRREGYPPIDDTVGAAPLCTFRFYNLGTRYNSEEDAWDDLDDIFETDAKTLGTLQYTFNSGRLNIYKHYGFEAREHTQDYTFISNTYEIEVETIQGEFGSDNEDRWERRPLQLPNTFVPLERGTFDDEYEWYAPYPDDWSEDGSVNSEYDRPNYYFIGDGCHDFRVELKSSQDGNDKFDISRELFLEEDMTGRGNVKDGIADDEGNIKPLKYTWKNVRAGNFYLKCREVGNASVAHYVRVNDEEHSRWQIYEDMTQQGVFFYGFDTSDTGEEDSQFKITTECDPDADEVNGKIVKTLERPDIQIFLMPRRIAYYARESGLDSEPTEFELVIGDGTRTVYRDDPEEFTPSEVSNPCLHAVIASTEDSPIVGDYEFDYDGVSLIGGMDCQSGSYCGGLYYSVGGGLWYCYGWQTDCTGTSDIFPASTDTYAVQSGCISYVDACNAAAAAGTDHININYTVKHKDATRRTHKHYIGLWYGQMPNKAFIYRENCCYDGTRSDLEDDTTKTDRLNESFLTQYGGGYFPAYIGYESEHDQYTIVEEFEEWCFCYDLEDPSLVDNYLFQPVFGIMWYLCPNIYHFHDPLYFQAQNFIEDAGGTQEEQDDVVNAIRTFHFFTYDFDYSNHNVGSKGFYRKYEYDYATCNDFIWNYYYTHDLAKDATWKSEKNFMGQVGSQRPMTCDYLIEDGLYSYPYYPHENEFGMEIFRKIQNSSVWGNYYDKSFGYEGRTYEAKPYGFGIVPAKAGTLAAIVKARSKVYYIWFKTDEDYKIWGRAKQLKDAGSRSTDEYELTEYEGYQLGFEDANCDNLIFGRYDEYFAGGVGADSPEQYWYEDGTSAPPTGFYNQCAGTGTRTVTHLGRTPVITWDSETSGDWVDGDDVTNGAYVPGQSGPCRVPYHTGSTSNHFKRGTLIAPNEGEFELDAPVVVVGSRDYPLRDNAKNNRNMWCMNVAKGELYFW